jgi:hypothetical protein
MIRLASSVLLLSLATWSGVLGQDNQPPVLQPHRVTPKPRPVKEKATLLLICDLPCVASVDGESLGAVAGGGSAKRTVELGKHGIVATSQDLQDIFTQLVDVQETGQSIVMIGLKPLRDARLAQQQQTPQVPAQQSTSTDTARIEELRAHAEERYQKSLEMREQKKPVEERALLEPACEGGQKDACVALGVMYCTGEGGTKDSTKGTALYELACAGGQMLGCANAGNHYYRGDGVAQNYERSRQLYQHACDGGNMDGCNGLGENYYYGYAVPQDRSRAYELYKRACDGEIPAGCFNLGWLYQYGLAVEKDVEKARQLYRKACDKGNPEACTQLQKL